MLLEYIHHQDRAPLTFWILQHGAFLGHYCVNLSICPRTLLFYPSVIDPDQIISNLSNFPWLYSSPLPGIIPANRIACLICWASLKIPRIPANDIVPHVRPSLTFHTQPHSFLFLHLSFPPPLLFSTHNTNFLPSKEGVQRFERFHFLCRVVPSFYKNDAHTKTLIRRSFKIPTSTTGNSRRRT